eukprot:Blabericola_migrator_1__236@NODE_1061_length_5558_cov_570_766891_g729_i0_p2_GENE_NODE_1061_length_5558_cov_570_766891_g729_i0NODE_1061_length_5558_cov_570_766891_g729_i0_p2_ORF_typecomplete_len539_score82_05_NODE_1061_length_5558_cov_570_766891_g729_i032874903
MSLTRMTSQHGARLGTNPSLSFKLQKISLCTCKRPQLSNKNYLMDVLSVGLGRFGSLAQTHFFNGCEETVRRVDEGNDSGLTELSAVSLGPFYQELSEDRFHPNLVIAENEAAELSVDTPPHPYQKWADESKEKRAAGFSEVKSNMDVTVKQHSDITDFKLPRVVEIRRNRPLSEHFEAVEDGLRQRFETMDVVSGLSWASELPADAPWDTPNPYAFVLEEVPKAGFVCALGVTPIAQRFAESAPLSPIDSLSSAAPVTAGGCGEAYIVHAAKARLAAIEHVYQIYQDFKGCSGKCILPVMLSDSFWGVEVPSPQFDVGGTLQPISSAYRMSAIGALTLDAISLPYRLPLTASSPFAVVGTLVPAYAPIVSVQMSLTSQAKGGSLNDISCFMEQKNSLLEQYPGHDHFLLTQHGVTESEMVRKTWINSRPESSCLVHQLKESFAVSNSFPWLSDNNFLDRAVFNTQATIRSPIDTSIKTLTGKAGFLESSIAFIEAASLNTTLIDRVRREEWMEVKNGLLDLGEDLGYSRDRESDFSD